MLHRDEAQDRVVKCLLDFLDGRSRSWRVLLVADVMAQYRVLLWCPETKRRAAAEEIESRLADAGGQYWSGDVLAGQRPREVPDGPWQAEAWAKAEEIGDGSALRFVERHLSKAGWFDAPAEPPWPLRRGKRSGAAICAFYSFGDGVGRSTALAATALQFASRGERVVVLDADLDSPSLGSLLPGRHGAGSQVGLVDYLLEAPLADGESGVRLADYCHRCSPSLHNGGGEAVVFPAGRLDERYIEKLARVDYGTVAGKSQRQPFVEMFQRIEAEFDPHWILVDARAGLAEVSGVLTGGICHLYVLLGSLAEAGWSGLRLVIERLGAERVLRGVAQCECLLAAAMIPSVEAGQYARSLARFTDRARNVFGESYYAESGARDSAWTVDDLANESDAPHVPVGLPYDSRLALFGDFSEVAEAVLLPATSPYAELAGRIRRSAERLREAA